MSGSFMIKRGESIGLVRWVGNQPELITGAYRGHTAKEWSIEVGGVVAAYPRSEWELCIA